MSKENTDELVKRIFQFESVIRAICTELGMTYGGVDVDSGEIVAEIKRLKSQTTDDMVNRFLCWKLPDSFSPDCGISFKAEFNENTPYPMKNEPTGTNFRNITI